MLSDTEAVKAFEGAKMGKPILVENVNGDDYYLVPYTKDKLATGVIMLDTQDGHFRQATWTSKPEKHLPVTEKEAANLVKKAIMKTGTKKGIKPGKAETSLEWQAGEYSQSPFSPYLVVTINDQDWIVNQDKRSIQGMITD